MADVSIPWRSPDDDRGQLLLITALSVAILLAAIALLLNAAIFTENVATRETGADGREALTIREATVADVGELIERENRRVDDSEDNASANVSDGIEAIEPLLGRETVRRGTIVDLEHTETQPGERIKWNTTERPEDFTLEPATEDDPRVSEWTLLSEVHGVRAFTLTLDEESLSTLNKPNATELENESTGAFGVELTGTDVSQYIYRDDGNVVVANVSGEEVDRCRIAAAEEATVDLTRGRLETEDERTDCARELWPESADVDVEEIRIVNGDRAGGTFELTADEETDVNPEDDEEITVTDAVYAATVEYRYRSDELDYRTTVEVAPGEPR